MAMYGHITSIWLYENVLDYMAICDYLYFIRLCMVMYGYISYVWLYRLFIRLYRIT